MPPVSSTPSPTIAQVSGKLPGGEPMLAVLAKRTYTVDRQGRLALADKQPPLVAEPEMDPELPALLIADSDLCPYKPRTDVVVHGHAWGLGRKRLDALVRVAGLEHKIAVFGERQASLAGKHIILSDPEPFEKVPLSYALAYGGRDRKAEAKYYTSLSEDPELVRSMQGIDLEAASPYIYPRNPVGRGYLIEKTTAAVHALQLPQLEDPTDLLTPQRIVAGTPEQWHRMPLPRATGWVDYAWYPRIAFFGVVPVVECFDEPPLEVERGLAPDYLADGTGQLPLERVAFDVANGASLGLQLPHLRGGEPVELHALHRHRPRWTFTVPPAPRLATDGRNGKLNPTEPVLHTLIVAPDLETVTVVWRGCAPALRAYAPKELEAMPLRVQWSD
jgi:hypothetical protein